MQAAATRAASGMLTGVGNSVGGLLQEAIPAVVLQAFSVLLLAFNTVARLASAPLLAALHVYVLAPLVFCCLLDTYTMLYKWSRVHFWTHEEHLLHAGRKKLKEDADEKLKAYSIMKKSAIQSALALSLSFPRSPFAPLNALHALPPLQASRPPFPTSSSCWRCSSFPRCLRTDLT
jgi:hypothetical protein